MPDNKIVINTTPIFCIISALDNLEILKKLYTEIIVPAEVKEEILRGGKFGFGIEIFSNSDFLKISESRVLIPNHLNDFLDTGEASVIATALEQKINLVAIDETEGRRFARIQKLNLTGSLGILIKARKLKYDIPPIKDLIYKIKKNGIWISEKLIEEAIKIDSDS